MRCFGKLWVTSSGQRNLVNRTSSEGGAEMRRFCYLGEQILLLFCRLGVEVHTFLWRPNGVTAACWIREPKGVGSIPAWGSNKTNEEVLELLLTWG